LFKGKNIKSVKLNQKKLKFYWSRFQCSLLEHMEQRGWQVEPEAGSDVEEEEGASLSWTCKFKFFLIKLDSSLATFKH